ncbi:hypothetical protein [Nocardia sp. NPDC057440]|uniref:hypothetical protein n=1 Tax=Nocardia sp. NPDC057440 TaxID=3346134 RepID=UPI0036721623
MGITEAARLSMPTRSGQTEKELIADLRPAADQAALASPRVRQADRDRDPAEMRAEVLLRAACWMDSMRAGMLDSP